MKCGKLTKEWLKVKLTLENVSKAKTAQKCNFYVMMAHRWDGIPVDIWSVLLEPRLNFT